MSERVCYYCGEGEYTADDHCPGSDPGWGHRFVTDEPDDEWDDFSDDDPDPIDPTHPGYQP